MLDLCCMNWLQSDGMVRTYDPPLGYCEPVWHTGGFRFLTVIPENHFMHWVKEDGSTASLTTYWVAKINFKNF